MAELAVELVGELLLFTLVLSEWEEVSEGRMQISPTSPLMSLTLL